MNTPAKASLAETKAEAAEPQPEADVQMTFLEHLGELRKRVIRAVLGIIPCVGVAWYFREQLLDFLTQPFVLAWRNLHLPGDPKLHFANPVDPFVSYMKISLVIGLLGAAPWIFWQIWAFIAPGLYSREKRFALPFVAFSTASVATGAYLGYRFFFPVGFQVFLGLSGPLPSSTLTVQPTVMLPEYLDFSTQMLLAFAVVAEVPVVLTFLAATGLVTHKTLLKHSRWWIVGSSIVAAVITPPDVGMQLVVFIPLVVLYFVSVAIAWLIGRGRAAPTQD